jgi:hypothetical protein
MPEASSSAPGARVVSVVPEPLIESRWPPSTTTSAALSVPLIVAMTDFCFQLACVNCSTVMSVRPPASVVQRCFSQSEEFTPPVVW